MSAITGLEGIRTGLGRNRNLALVVFKVVGVLVVTPLLVTARALPNDQPPLDPGLDKEWIKDLPRATPDEALLGTYNENKAQSFLDDTSLKWARQNSCGTCHTTIPYLMARPLIGGAEDRKAWDEVRQDVAKFAFGRIGKHADDAAFITGTTVAALAVGDAHSGRPLQSDTRALFTYMWESQTPAGNWVTPQKGMLPFLERDPRYVAFMVALAIGCAPSLTHEEPAAKSALSKLQAFIRNNPPDSVHDKAVLLWASVRTPGLLTPEEQGDYAHSILALQKSDGGWSLPSLGEWPRRDGAPNDPHGDSDGYATSLAALALCQHGYGIKDAPVKQAMTWIQQHQRVSGRWYTRSLYSDRFQNYLSNMGTAYAIMALDACGA